MTVKELIAELSKLPADWTVEHPDGEVEKVFHKGPGTIGIGSSYDRDYNQVEKEKQNASSITSNNHS
jgi:hypothetical protein